MSTGKIQIEDGSEVPGVLGHPVLCKSQVEITAFGGWHNYMDSKILVA